MVVPASITEPIVNFAVDVIEELGLIGIFAVVAVGVSANVLGSSIADAVGYYGRVDVLERHGRELHLKLTVLTTLGCIPWILLLTLIGREAGSKREDWKDSLHYIHDAVAALIALGAASLVVRHRRTRLAT